MLSAHTQQTNTTNICEVEQDKKMMVTVVVQVTTESIFHILFNWFFEENDLRCCPTSDPMCHMYQEQIFPHRRHW